MPEHTSHTIFLVDENSRNDVLEKFAALCEIEVPIDCTKPIKTVGAVGVRKDEGLTICHYVSSYDKSYSTNTFKPNKLIHYFYESRKYKSTHDAYRLILEGIAKTGQLSNSTLSFSDGSEERYAVSSIRKYLKDSGEHINFNIAVKSLINVEIEEAHWEQATNTFKAIFNLKHSDFMDFDNRTTTVENPINPNEEITEVNGRIIKNEIATIHSLKGETHAATLVLETKNHEFDVGQLIEYILGEKTTTPTGVRKPKFMKQLYVAFSRPKHLLCVAMDKSRFPAEHADKTEYAGWKIVDLTN